MSRARRAWCSHHDLPSSGTARSVAKLANSALPPLNELWLLGCSPAGRGSRDLSSRQHPDLAASRHQLHAVHASTGPCDPPSPGPTHPRGGLDGRRPRTRSGGAAQLHQVGQPLQLARPRRLLLPQVDGGRQHQVAPLKQRGAGAHSTHGANPAQRTQRETWGTDVGRRCMLWSWAACTQAPKRQPRRWWAACRQPVLVPSRMGGDAPLLRAVPRTSAPRALSRCQVRHTTWRIRGCSCRGSRWPG
jgi:hypothetical protein